MELMLQSNLLLIRTKAFLTKCCRSIKRSFSCFKNNKTVVKALIDLKHKS